MASRVMCNKGLHELSGDNLCYQWNGGKRVRLCRECRLTRTRGYYSKKTGRTVVRHRASHQQVKRAVEMVRAGVGVKEASVGTNVSVDAIKRNLRGAGLLLNPRLRRRLTLYERIHALYSEGLTYNEIAVKATCSFATVVRAMREYDGVVARGTASHGTERRRVHHESTRDTQAA